jgi:hypothetical protein
MKKYPRTYHLPFSPEVHSDDKVIPMEFLNNFLNREVIITEKLDGQNNCLKGNQGVFARSHQVETKHEWDHFLKSFYYQNMHKIDPNIWYFLENLFAVHSVEYEELTNYFYMFAAYKQNQDIWTSWKEVENLATALGIETAPVLYQGIFKSIKEIEIFMNKNIKEKSKFGKEKEGFVIRVADSFPGEDFQKNVAKYVRKGHVQTDEHWTKNWKQARIKKCGN